MNYATIACETCDSTKLSAGTGVRLPGLPLSMTWQMERRKVQLFPLLFLAVDQSIDQFWPVSVCSM